jgi:hypothetical protein
VSVAPASAIAISSFSIHFILGFFVS